MKLITTPELVADAIIDAADNDAGIVRARERLQANLNGVKEEIKRRQDVAEQEQGAPGGVRARNADKIAEAAQTEAFLQNTLHQLVSKEWK